MNKSLHSIATLTPAMDSPQSMNRQRGKLRIFLGYAAGVGKTYAMLDAAQQRHTDGVDVVIANVETHAQAEIDTLVKRFEVVDHSIMGIAGGSRAEMDLDAVLARRPALTVVDELAHANAPGSRHPQRYQDVEELLDAGIDVYTTLNIQQLESLKDVVVQITGVVVPDTIPDRILDTAEEIEVIDLPPAELLRRIEDGKVHIPSQADQGAAKFFRPGNLSALRELALRRAAARVDEQMRSYMQRQAIVGPWPANEGILVCVSPSPLSERLVRAARRLAARVDAEWYAVYVATPAQASLSERERDQVARTLRLAEELGAKAITTSATSIVEGIIAYASNHNITKLIAGKPLRPRWRELLHGSVVDQIIRRGQDIDVYVISGASPPSLRQPSLRRPADRPSRQSLSPKRFRGYVWGAGIVALTTLLGLPIRAYIDPTNMVMLYLVGIVVTALQWGRGPSILASLLSVVAFDVAFVLPYHTIVVSDAEYLLTFVGLFLVGVVVSTLAARTAAQVAAAQEREEQVVAAFELSRDLATALTPQDIAQQALQHVQRVFGGGVALYQPSVRGVSLQQATADYAEKPYDVEIATWALQHRQPAGAGTGTLPGARVRCLPLLTAQGAVGVLALALPTPDLLPSQRRLLESFANQIALALERAQLADAANELRLVQEREKLQTALLSSISHDLRTPLATITGALSALQEQEDLLQPSARHALVATAHEQATRLNQLVGNLLDMSRLESGSVQVRRELCDPEDLVGAALERMGPALTQHQIKLDVPRDLPLVPMDFVLMVQVLTNLLDNAAKYSSPQTTITIQVMRQGQAVEITLADEGTGIPPEELEPIFAKFYRVVQGDSVVGTGLGLSIAKGLVEAHGGRVWATNRPGGGSIFTVSLPLEISSSSDEVTP